MSVRLTFGIIGFFLFFLPLIVSAQENQPQPGLYCPHLTRDLKKGDRDATTGGQVTELQKFLVDYYDLDPDEYVTGYFGYRTQQNVIKFQREQNLPAFGYVGPLTRAAIARVCGTQATPPLPPPPANQCTPLPPQTQTLQCPTGQTGAIIQTRYSTCPGPTWGPWTTTSNTCTTPPPPPPPPPPLNVGSCTYKGQSYAEGQTISVSLVSFPVNNTPVALLCDNHLWVFTKDDVTKYAGQNVCDWVYPTSVDPAVTSFGCTNTSWLALLAVVPRHGVAPLTVRTRTAICHAPPGYTLTWGDGTSDTIACAGNTLPTSNHTYVSAGTYVISYTNFDGLTNSANIRVDPSGVTLNSTGQVAAGTASTQNQSPNQSQLASVLAALESALKAFLKLLGQ